MVLAHPVAKHVPHRQAAHSGDTDTRSRKSRHRCPVMAQCRKEGLKCRIIEFPRPQQRHGQGFAKRPQLAAGGAGIWSSLENSVAKELKDPGLLKLETKE